MAGNYGRDDNSVPSKLDRRSYMKVAGATGAVLGGASVFSGSAVADEVDLGAEGLEEGDTIDGYLSEHFTSNTEVHIPPGQYRWNGDGVGGSYSNAALIGDGDPGAVQFDFPDGNSRYSAVRATGGEVRLENITITGRTTGDTSKLRAEARDSEATMVLDKIWLPDGVVEGSEGNGMYVGRQHAGTVVFRDCWVEGFADNGLYASSPGGSLDDSNDGRVVVEGGLYKNNNISNLRLGTTDSVARGVTLVHDDIAPDNGGAINQRNLRIRQGGENILIEDCDIYHEIDSYWPFELSHLFSGGSGLIRDTRIYTNSSRQAIGSHEGDWRAENVDVTGSGDRSIGVPSTGGCTGGECDVAARKPRAPLPNSRDDEPVTQEDDSDADAHQVTFISEGGADESSYEFSGTGSVAPLSESPYLSPSGNEVRATSNYEIDEDSDGYLVSGSSANGYGDAYAVTGAITDATLNHPETMVIELDGDRVTPEELVAATGDDDSSSNGNENEDRSGGDEDGTDSDDEDGGNSSDEDGNDSSDEDGGDSSTEDGTDSSDDENWKTLTIDGSFSDTVAKYVITVSGEIEPDDSTTSMFDGGNAWDALVSSISDGKAIGVVGRATDGFRYTGNVLTVEIRGDAHLRLRTQ